MKNKNKSKSPRKLDIKHRISPKVKSQRKGSVRKLENFDQIREQFQSLAMSQSADNVIVADGSNVDATNDAPSDERSPSMALNGPQSADNLSNSIQQNLNDREKPLRMLNQFASQSNASRAMLAAVQNKVSLYTKVKELDVNLEYLHSEWLDCCGLTVEELEEQSHALRPSLINKKFDESGDIIDKVEAAFKSIKKAWPEKQVVVDHLDFVDGDNKVVEETKEHSDPGSSVSVAQGKGKAYIVAKFPKLKAEIEKRFSNIKKKFEEGKDLSQHQLDQMLKQLDSLENKVGDDSPFEKLLRDAYELPDYDQKDLDSHEDWQSTNKALIESLIESVSAANDKKHFETHNNAAAAASTKPSYNVFLKKQDPPKFSGDCLDYIEFKRKWQSQVSAHKPPAEYEMDLLRKSLPEEGRKKLYNVDSMSSAWIQLEKLYGDKSLICQKLKSKIKCLKPSSTEAHEVVIEIYNEIEYLVKRLRDFDAVSLLYYDNEYLNACYKHLPSLYQHEWDKYDSDEYEHTWLAFMVFMENNAKSALKKRTLMESLKDMGNDEKTKKTPKAAIGTTKVEEDPNKSSAGSGSKSPGEMNEKQAKKYEEMKAKAGKCKVCNVMHTFQNRFMKHPLPSDRFYNCTKFKNMNAKARGETLEKHSACVRCTSWSHNKSACPASKVSCKEQIDGTACGKDHSKLVCQSGIPYCTNLTVNTAGNIDQDAPTIPYIHDIKVKCNNVVSEARTFWDTGSNRMLINNSFASERKLHPKAVTVIMKVAGGEQKHMQVNIYEFDLVDRSGISYRVWGYGVDTIIEPDETVDPSLLRNLFPHIPSEVFDKLEERRLDLLIGLNYNGLFPTGGEGKNCCENIKVMKTKFGKTGWILGGSHSSLNVVNPQLSNGALSILTAARIQCIPEVLVEDIDAQVERELDRVSVLKVSVEPQLTPEYWESDNLSILPPRRCSRCKQCSETGECSEKHLIHSIEEEADLRALEKSVEIVDGVTIVRYPFKKDPSCLPYNRSSAINIASKLWENLKRDGLLEAYNAEIKKYLDRDTFVQLSKEEMADYAGPINYITHHGVLKDSVTTPLRVVTNSSHKNGKYSLNDLLPKGPNSLNDMLAVTVRFRAYDNVFAYDLSKAYNTMKTGIVEKHLRRFIWRFDESSPWIDFAIDAVHFGDRPAATLLEVSKDKMSKKGESIDPIASKKLIEDVYVDDGFSGGSNADIDRMVGKKLESGRYDGTLSKILAIGGWEVKEFVVEGDMEQSDDNLLNNSVFGYKWNPKTKYMSLKFNINLSKKRRGVRVSPDLTVEDLKSLGDMKMTKRILLGVTNGHGDFLGLADPFTIRFKLLMKNLFDGDSNLSWDDPISNKERQAWIKIITEAVQCGEHVFPRKTRPDNAVAGPRVSGCGDGAFPAFGGCVYLIWEHSCPEGGCNDKNCRGEEGGHYAAYLVLAKGRVTPLNGFTVFRSEMSGGVVTSRMVLRVVRSLQSLDMKPISAIILLDSECTICTLEESAKHLKPFFHNRRAEILENMESVSKYCEMEPVHWVASADNPADMLTRGAVSLHDIGPDSMWQQGPKFFSLPRGEWPVNRDCISRANKIPKEEMRAASTFLAVDISSTPSISSLYEKVESILNASNDLNSRIRVVARLIKASAGNSSDSIYENLCPEDIQKAEKLILLTAMVSTVKAFERGELSSLMPYWSGNLLVTRGRLGETALEPLLGVSELPILMANTRVAKLYMWRSHLGHSGPNKCGFLHRAVAETLARSRRSVWIVRGKQVAKKVCSSCMECRKLKQVALGQQMASLCPESSTVCPPWTYVSLDYAGPVIIKGEVNKRSRGKGWILVYVCRSTKAVCLLPTAGYDTASFLVRHREFVARKGRPRSIVSDRGTQLVKSGIILAEKDSPQGWDWAKVVERNQASDWHFVPVGAAHRNGLAEATVKILKQCLHHALGPGVELSFSELNTLLAEISYAINCRPLGLSNVSADSEQEDFLSPITPNQLLLGRTNDEGLPLDYDGDDRFTTRLAYVSQVFDSWWKKWIKQVLPSLMPLKRWKDEKRNLQVGDVVMMLYAGNIKNDYRLAKVLEVHPDRRNLVRTVTVGYRRRNKNESAREYKSRPLVKEKVSVQRLSLLVPIDAD